MKSRCAILDEQNIFLLHLRYINILNENLMFQTLVTVNNQHGKCFILRSDGHQQNFNFFDSFDATFLLIFMVIKPLLNLSNF